MTSHARWTVLTWRVRRPLVGGHGVEALDHGAGAVARVRQPRRESGDPDPAGHLAVGVEPSEQGLGDVALRLRHELDGRELDRLVVVHPAGERVADAHLDRDGDGADGEGDDEPEAVVAVAPAAQHARRRRPTRRGTRRRRRRRSTMWAAISGIASLKITAHGSTSTTLPAESSVKPCGSFIQALAATTETLPRMPVSTTGTPVQKCGPRFQAAPAVDVDRDEDRLGEEEDALEGERDAERLAPLAHEPRPQQPELEASAPSR